MTEALKDTLRYVYFGTDDIVSIIQTRPDSFERAMKEIFGSAGLAIIERICEPEGLEAFHAATNKSSKVVTIDS